MSGNPPLVPTTASSTISRIQSSRSTPAATDDNIPLSTPAPVLLRGSLPLTGSESTDNNSGRASTGQPTVVRAEPMSEAETSLFLSSVSNDDIKVLREMGLLRGDLVVGTDRCCLETCGFVSDHGRNLATTSFESRTALQQRCREFARRSGFSLKVASNSWHKDSREGNAKYSCKLLKGQQQLFPEGKANCPFHITVYGIRDEWKITKMCVAHDHYRHAGFQEDTFVEGDLAGETVRQRRHDVPFSVMLGLVEREMLPAYSGSWASVKGKAIIDFLMSKQITTNRQTASKIKLDLLASLRRDMLESYQKLESFLAMITAHNPTSHYAFEKADGGVFRRSCFFPSACLQATQHCRHIIVLDGTHLKGDMNKRGVFLLATTKDLNGHIVVFGLALVGQEDYSNWCWFLTEMKLALATGSVTWKPVFVSDRQKGLLASMTELYPDSGHRFCVRHIISNIEKKGSALSPNEQALIFQMARSECENDYKYYSSRLADTRPLAVEYLNAIDKSHWVTYAFNEAHNQPSYDEVTSNLSEAANSWLGNSCRTSYPLQAFEALMVKVVELFAARRRSACREKSVCTRVADPNVATSTRVELAELTPEYKNKLEEMLALTKSLHILPCLEGQYLVRFTDVSTRPDHAHMWRTVNLPDRECTCRRWQDEQFPSVHALKAAIHHGMHVTELFDFQSYTVSAYKSTYFYQLVPQVSSNGLKQDKNLSIPEVIVAEEELGKRGRKPGPKPKHKRKAARPGSAANPTIAMTQ